MNIKLSITSIAVALNIIISFCLADENSDWKYKIKDLLNQGYIIKQGFKIQANSPSIVQKEIIKFYEENSYNLFWSDNRKLNKKFIYLQNSVADSLNNGLNPADYALEKIADNTDLAEKDILLTLKALQLAADAKYGRFKIRQIDSQNFRYGQLEQADLNILIKELSSAENPEVFINNLYPRHSQYLRMKNALREYRAIKENYKIPVIKGCQPLRTGSAGELVHNLSLYLKAYGDLSGNTTKIYTKELAEAVKKFQKRHGIPETGEVHEKTCAALSLTIENRINTLIVNLERWRFLSRDFSAGKEIFVNIAGFELFALEDGKIKHRLTTIVGKPFQATPVFSDMIEYIEFNPYWNVPPSIVVNEILKKQRADTDYLKNEKIRIYSANGSEIPVSSVDFHKISVSQAKKLRFRQDYGSVNVLGKLKFVFPNPFNIYLHDTSSPNLFGQSTRAFSHGCIRVKQPQLLAAFLLDNPEDKWTTERVQSTIDSNKNINIKLKQKVPIHLTYRTAWVEADSKVNFRNDVYSRDKAIFKGLADSI